jgi:hypothetical protein
MREHESKTPVDSATDPRASVRLVGCNELEVYRLNWSQKRDTPHRFRA